MRPRFVVSLAAVALTLAVVVNAASALTLEHVVRIDPARLSLTMSNGLALLEARGGVHEYTAGRPDLPGISERGDLPAGMRLVSVEVVAAQTELWADGVRVAPALSSRAGAPPDERSAASALFYTSASFQPEVLAATGVQGSLRGRNVAYLRIAPARWNAQTGRLERVTSLDLKLTLEDGAEPAVTRERIVREWEDEPPSGVPSRAIVSLSSEATAGGSGKPKAEPFKPLQVPSVLGSPVEYVIVTSD